ncbi:MAG: tetratricopeptide repeat protein [Candidatus Omnitrophica bacterium]|nr:tetratricopeptide repeat protein [Candidatus Omnitrophota bacterium]
MYTFLSNRFTFAILALFLICLIAYGSSLKNNFLIDDMPLVVNNQIIQNPHCFYLAFKLPFMSSYYRPITTLSFTCDYLVWKYNAFGYHLTNILLHATVSALFFALIYLLFSSFELSLISSCLFAVHPLNSVNVNYISDRGNLLVSIFMLASLLSFFHAYKNKKNRYYFLGFLLSVIALFCRENAIIFPLYLACLLTAAFEKNRLKIIVSCTSFSLLISGLYYFLRTKLLNLPVPIPPLPKLSFLTAHFEQMRAFLSMILTYTRLLFVPANIAFYRPVKPLTANLSLLLFFSFIALAVYLYHIRGRVKKSVLFALGFFLSGILPLYILLRFRLQLKFTMQDSWIYFSSIGLFMLLGELLLYLKNRADKKLYRVFLILLFTFFITTTWQYNPLWHDTVTYCNFWLKILPKNYIAYRSLAQHYAMKRDFDRAAGYYLKALKLNRVQRGEEMIFTKKASEIFTELGIVFHKQGKFEQALPYLFQALKINPYSSFAHLNLANTYYRLEKFDLAEQHYRKVTELNPYHLKARQKLAVLYVKTGKEALALKETEVALSLSPHCFDRVLKSQD